MKKPVFLMLLAACTLSNAWAGIPSRPIVLRPATPRPVTQPRPLPLSETANCFTVYTIDESIIITSESVTDIVQVYVIDKDGATIFSTSATMAPGSEISIPTADWDAGEYTLYIEYDSILLEGDFELE